MKKLILWDIDGTLIVSHGAGVRAMERALTKRFGVTCDKPEHFIVRSEFIRVDGKSTHDLYTVMEEKHQLSSQASRRRGTHRMMSQKAIERGGDLIQGGR